MPKLFALVFSILLTTSTAFADSFSQAHSIIVNNSKITFNTQIKHDEDKQLKYKITVVYPQIQEDSATNYLAFNTYISKIMRQMMDHFIKNVKENYEFNHHENLDSASSLNIKYTATTFNNHYLSIRFTVDSYIQGTPYPNVNFKVVNFDLIAKKSMSLKDIFKPHSNYLKFIKEYCSKRLSILTQMDEAQIKKSYLDLNTWNLQPTGILFTFDDFPHVIGPQKVLISYKKITEYLTPEFNSELDNFVTLSKK